jgi:Flp pilus assembly pilin Flp
MHPRSAGAETQQGGENEMLEFLQTGLVRIQSALVAMRDEEGQAMVEYALILALVSIAAIAVLPGLGTAVTGALSSVTAAF